MTEYDKKWRNLHREKSKCRKRKNDLKFRHLTFDFGWSISVFWFDCTEFHKSLVVDILFKIESSADLACSPISI